MNNRNTIISIRSVTFGIRIFGFFSCNLKHGRRFERGFTLIELLIVMGIIALLAGASLSSLNKSRTQNALRSGSQQVVLAFRTAEANALAVKEIGGQYPGYGVYIPGLGVENVQYWIYADANENHTFDSSEPIITKFTLPLGAVFKEIDGDNSNFGLAVQYERPQPTVYIFERNVKITTGGSASLCIGTTDSALTRTITVWRTGHVSLGDYEQNCGH